MGRYAGPPPPSSPPSSPILTPFAAFSTANSARTHRYQRYSRDPFRKASTISAHTRLLDSGGRFVRLIEQPGIEWNVRESRFIAWNSDLILFLLRLAGTIRGTHDDGVSFALDPFR